MYPGIENQFRRQYVERTEARLVERTKARFFAKEDAGPDIVSTLVGIMGRTEVPVLCKLQLQIFISMIDFKLVQNRFQLAIFYFETPLSSPKFLYWLIPSPAVVEIIHKKKRNTTRNLANLSTGPKAWFLKFLKAVLQGKKIDLRITTMDYNYT